MFGCNITKQHGTKQGAQRHINALASCLIYAQALLEYVILFCGWILSATCYRREIRGR